MIEKFKDLLDRLLIATQPLAEEKTVNGDQFMVTMLGMYRVSFSTLRDIKYLALHIETASSVLDLARKITEYSLTVEYMLLKGKGRAAQEFQEHLWVQLYKDGGFLKMLGFADLAEAGESSESSFSVVDKEFKKVPTGHRDRHSWAGKSTDQMVKLLYDAGRLSQADFNRIAQAYIWGSRANHPNPLVVKSFLDSAKSEQANDLYMQHGLFLALSFHLRLTTRYIDEIRVAVGRNEHKSIANEVSKIYEELNSL